MNPAAPVWVSSATSSSSSGGRSTLDPNSAAFRPKSALSSGAMRASGSTPTAATIAPVTTPATFTRYIGNPIVSNGYHHSHTNAQVPSPSYAGRSNPANNIVASAAAPYSSSSLPPPSGRPSHHNHHHISQSLYQTAGGRSGSGAPTFYYADAALASATPQPLASFQQPPHHTTAAPSHHGINNTNLTYSAKANTHWGAAGGPPSNITQTHQHHGTVHYNQHLVQRTPPSATFHASSENALSSAHHNVGAAAAGPNTASTTAQVGGGVLGASPTRTEILLQEDVLFTPSTRGIWSGSAPVATDRALDSALELLLMRESAEGQQQQQGLSSSQQTTIPVQRKHNEQEASDSSSLVAASAVVAVQPFDPSLLESIQGNGQAPSTHISIPDAAPWAALLGASSTSSTAQHHPSHHQKGGADADHVNTVQHLLAQLTRESPTGKQERPLPAVETKEAVLTTHTENPIVTANTPGRSIAVAASVTPPAAIGGSPTSPSSVNKGQSCNAKQVSSTGDGSAVNMKPAPRSQRLPQTVQQRPEMDAAVSIAPSINTIAETAPHPVQSNALSDGDVTPAAAAAGVDAAAPAAEARWTNRHDVEHFLKGAKETLRHIKILSFSKQYHDEVAKLFQGWAEKGIPAPDDVFGAYYFYVAKKCGMELCMKHNGRGRIPGVGYGGCDFANRGPKFRCRFHHVCLFCKGEDHGWFDEGKCERYQAFRSELERLQITDAEITGIVDAYDNR